MPTFSAKPFLSKKAPARTLGERIATTYRRHLVNHPFLLFGLPFVSVIVASSFLLTPATALRYERHDQKHRQLSHSEALELGLRGGPGGEGEVSYNPRRRKVTKGGLSEKDEYYVIQASGKVSLDDADTSIAETHGQRPRQLGTEASGKMEGRTGRQIVALVEGQFS